MKGIHTYIMPTIGLSDLNNGPAAPAAHRRKDYGELHVFEATRYFSGDGYTGGVGEGSAARAGEKSSSEMLTESIPPSQPSRNRKLVKERKWKQPSSPGAKLAIFLNSFFHQTASKKKSKSNTTNTTTTRPLKEGEEICAGRKGKSNISQSQSIRSSDSRSIYSCVRTPPLYPNNPTTMIQKELSSSYPYSKCNNDQPKAVTYYPQIEVWEDNEVIEVPWLAEYDTFSDGFLEKNLSNGYLGNGGRLQGKGFAGKDGVCSSDGYADNKWVVNDEFLNKDEIWVGEFSSSRWWKKYSRSAEHQVDDDEEDGVSDCSSDLFELKNYELGDLSSCLPVYGATEMKVIKRGIAIASVTY